MVSTKQACEMARTLEGISEKDHFGSDAFVANKRIFATVWHDRNEVNLILNREQQRRYLSVDGEGFAEIDNAWGRAGATKVQLAYVGREDFVQALRSAWQHSAVKRTWGSSPRSGGASKSKKVRRATLSGKKKVSK